jgi:hypothetical protein
MLEKIVLYRAKFVAGIVGQIISMQAVFRSLVRLRTRELYPKLNLSRSYLVVDTKYVYLLLSKNLI